MPDRPADSVDINSARLAADPLLAEIAKMVAYMDLHIGRHEIKQMTTRQKELWADLVDAEAINVAHEDESMRPPRRTVRWWRDYRRPAGEEGHAHGEQTGCRTCGRAITWDADIERFWVPYEFGNPPPGTFHCPWGDRHWALHSGVDEPDPFAYVDEGGSRTRGADLPSTHNAHAAQVARGALLDVQDASHPHWRTRDDDFAAVYEWAKQAARPLRMTAGARSGQIGSWSSYPSRNAARTFLTVFRAGRSA